MAAAELGLNKTIEFRWRPTEGAVETRETFETRVLEEGLGLVLDDVHSLQSNPKDGSYEVSLKTEEKAEEVSNAMRLDPSVTEMYRVKRLGQPNLRLITVHLFNTFVPDGVIADWLGQYGEVLPGARKVVDPRGYWTGRRQFRVLLAPDPEGHDGLSHPPAFLNIGPVRGYLFYPRQPQACRRCRTTGHGEADCRGLRCHACNSADHLLRACPDRRQANAEKTKRSRRRRTRASPRGADRPVPTPRKRARSEGAEPEPLAPLQPLPELVPEREPRQPEAELEAEAAEPVETQPEAEPQLEP